MTSQQLDRLHSIMVEILDEIVRICEAHDLRYYLLGGTLLGAVRHKGFIPWDDDLDMGMPRADYDRFCALCATELDGKYRLHSIATDPSYWLPFVKVRRRGTVFVERELGAADVPECGIWVDIFPIDNELTEQSFAKHCRSSLIKRMGYLINCRKTGRRPVKWSQRLCLPLVNMLSYRHLDTIRTRLMTWNNGKPGKFFVNHGSQYDPVRQTMPIAYYEPCVTAEFEGKTYRIPGQSHKVLARIYGDDYMRIPPPEQRVTHTPVRLSFDTGGKDENLTAE